ncbi:leucine-rich repeat protein [Coraliomargarita algicola]|uniref:Leucine-rich repeat protein n=1 Tax=Coraliomargarita algicola TaxID=3092156 RepID=A0ABZ0RQM8_9BACT|nr:leucine-rich repeat protein [Coraliomargarita sp. J2-16]WPJ97812.1 leucine-rich repeat protein [Coraliomargarita sp. J2-16]
MKRLIHSIFCLLALSGITSWGNAETYLVAGTNVTLTYSVSGDSAEVTITDCNEDAMGALIIPAMINSQPVTRISDDAFRGCSSLTAVTISNGVTEIGNSAFYQCRDLQSIIIPDSVTSIGMFSFGWCEDLSVVTISSRVVSIGYNAFALCHSLLSIDVDPMNQSYTSIDGVLFNKSKSTLINYPSGRTGPYEIPHGVVTIERSAFLQSYHLTEISMPSSLETIHALAFNDCSSLTHVTIPSNVSVIGIAAFEGCSRLKSISILGNLDSIGNLAFDRCWRLTNISFEAGAPSHVDSDIFYRDTPSNLTIYFYEGAVGFSEPTWQGFTAVMLSGPAEDLDGDGWGHKLESRLGTDVRNSNDHLQNWISKGIEGLKLHYGPHSDNVNFAVEYTTDLTDPDSWLAVDELDFAGDQGEQVATLPDHDGSHVFYRISASAAQ